MSNSTFYTTDHEFNESNGDLVSFYESSDFSVYYVIDAVSCCENPKEAAVKANEFMQLYFTSFGINEVQNIRLLIYDLHNYLKGENIDLAICIAGVVHWSNSKRIAFNIGDSRVYEIQPNAIVRVTRDDTFIQDLIDSGEITPLEGHHHFQKNILKQVVGGNQKLEINIYSMSSKAVGFLITSDGIHGELLDSHIHEIFFSQGNSRAEIYSKLIEESKVNDGYQDDQSVFLKWF